MYINNIMSSESPDFRELERMRKEQETARQAEIYNIRFPTKPAGTTNILTQFIVDGRIKDIRAELRRAWDEHALPRETIGHESDLMYLKEIKKKMLENPEELYANLDNPCDIAIKGAGANYDGTATWRQLLERYFWIGATLKKPRSKSMSPRKSKGSRGGSRKKRGTRRHRK